MQIVIEIPDKTYEKIMSNEYDYGDMNVIIQNGTPLPKGHGRLIDADALEPDICHDWDGLGVPEDSYSEECMRNAPTIIEADKGDD